MIDIGNYQINSNGFSWDGEDKYKLIEIVLFDNKNNFIENKWFYIQGKANLTVFKHLDEKDIAAMYSKPQYYRFHLQPAIYV